MKTKFKPDSSKKSLNPSLRTSLAHGRGGANSIFSSRYPEIFSEYKTTLGDTSQSIDDPQIAQVNHSHYSNLIRWVLPVLLLAMVATAFGAANPINGDGVGKPTHEVSTAPDEAVIITPPPDDDANALKLVQDSKTPGKGKYVVKSGDSLWDIATRLLGDGNRYMEIVEMNRGKYTSLTNNPSLIYAGWELDLPGDAVGPKDDAPDGTSSAPEDGTVRVGTSLNVRSSPWGGIIGSLHDNDKVSVIGKSGDWYKISWNGQEAFVHSNYVATASKPAGQTPVQTSGGNTDQSPPPPTTGGSGRFGAAPAQPMPGYASSEFGPRDLYGSFHYGIDLPVPTGTRLNALGDGVVSAAGYEPGGGTFLKFRYDNGLESFYCHLKGYSVSNGQRVSMGQEVARSDNTGQYTTGAHLHMGIKKNGAYVNPRSILGLPLP